MTWPVIRFACSSLDAFRTDIDAFTDAHQDERGNTWPRLTEDDAEGDGWHFINPSVTGTTRIDFDVIEDLIVLLSQEVNDEGELISTYEHRGPHVNVLLSEANVLKPTQRFRVVAAAINAWFVGMDTVELIPESVRLAYDVEQRSVPATVGGSKLIIPAPTHPKQVFG